MARKKKSSGGGLIIGVVILLALLAKVPKELWILIGIIAAVFILAYIVKSVRSSSSAQMAASQHSDLVKEATASTPRRKTSVGLEMRLSDDDIPLAKAASAQSANFRIPATPKGFGHAQWIPAGESITVGDTLIPGGMLYVGTKLLAPSGSTDPCLIDPSLPVAKRGDYTERDMGYWPSYSTISGTARRAYLNWLAGGRSDPEADVGYPFLFLYGLERRVLVDGVKDPAAQADLPGISAELNRLLDIYGPKSGSFQRYAGELLDWIELVGTSDKLYAKPIPKLARTYELPIYLRLALGQAAVDGVPVPPALALAWVRYDPSIALRTPAQRCPEQFDTLFTQQYVEAYGEGLVLTRNRTKLKFVYRPASAGFSGQEIKLSFGDLPDVTALTAPSKKLQQLVETATTELDSFSRFAGKNANAAESLEGWLLLPMPLWPASARAAVDAIKARMAGGMVVFALQDLMTTLGGGISVTRNKIQQLIRALESANIGFEPDVLTGARTPKLDSKVVLFALPPSEAISRTTPAYQAALLTLELASAMAVVDGEFSAKEINHLRLQIEVWSHLTPNHQRRLKAHLRLLIIEPMTLTALKKRFNPLSLAEREAIGAFMATVAQSDGAVSPSEIKLLEKLYKAFGIDAKKVFSDLHAVAVGDTVNATQTPNVETGGFVLDPARIAALQQDTNKVSALLSGIFTEAEEEAAPVVEPPDTPEDVPQNTGLLGLDELHSAFARLLLSRPQWSREELEDAAADLDLMLDGALEALNEAAFDTYDIPFIEGDDPIEVSAEVVEKLAV